MSDLDIQLDRDAGRFEAVVEGHSCYLDFTLDGEIVGMDHVNVPKAVGGRGIAGKLTRHALDWASEQGLKVQAHCPYVASWIKRHPEYEKLLA
ncbi:MAG TPA: GNAT family N-acetyltransferase [Wenzhouxiangella sp.]|nr:GNAT family N-acetyltransferase [Wenzhouxiangella sp.]